MVMHNLPDMLVGYRVGDYIGLLGGSNSTVITADRLYAQLTPIWRDTRVDQLALGVQAAGGAGTKARLGIYRVTSALLPGALIVDAGEVAVDATGNRTSPAISVWLTRGWYYLAFVSDGAPTVWGNSSHVHWVLSPLGLLVPANYPYSGGYAAHVYAALPDPCPALTLTAPTWAVSARVAEL